MTSPRHCIILIGDSHLHAVLNGYAALASESVSPIYQVHKFGGAAADHRYHPMVTVSDTETTWNDAFIGDVAECAERHNPVLIAAAWGGNAHYVNGSVRHPRPYDFVLPSAPDLPLVEGSEIVPYDLLRSIFRRPASILSSLWGRLEQVCQTPIYHLAAPPPARSADIIAKYLPPDWRPRAESLGIAPPIFRYKVWRLFMELTKEATETAGASFEWPPAGAVDANGLLRDEYAGDGIHGNLGYGRLVARQIGHLVETRT